MWCRRMQAGTRTFQLRHHRRPALRRGQAGHTLCPGSGLQEEQGRGHSRHSVSARCVLRYRSCSWRGSCRTGCSGFACQRSDVSRGTGCLTTAQRSFNSTVQQHSRAGTRSPTTPLYTQCRTYYTGGGVVASALSTTGGPHRRGQVAALPPAARPRRRIAWGWVVAHHSLAGVCTHMHGNQLIVLSARVWTALLQLHWCWWI